MLGLYSLNMSWADLREAPRTSRHCQGHSDSSRDVRNTANLYHTPSRRLSADSFFFQLSEVQPLVARLQDP